jgi:non-specific protein-tyrosine kinase
MAEQPNLITLTDPRNPATEAYRTLRTNLTFAALDKPIETLVVTSAAPDAGKLEVLANLAVTMAQGERRTILVDADLRRPGLHEIFGTANDRGLTTMIVEETALDDPPLIAVGVDNLWLVPSGPLPPNPDRRRRAGHQGGWRAAGRQRRTGPARTRPTGQGIAGESARPHRWGRAG